MSRRCTYSQALDALMELRESATTPEQHKLLDVLASYINNPDLTGKVPAHVGNDLKDENGDGGI